MKHSDFNPGTATVGRSTGIRLPVDPDPPVIVDLKNIIQQAQESVFVAVKIKTKNPTNNREHWRTVSRRSKQEHEAVAVALLPHSDRRHQLAEGCDITLTRISSGTLDDDGLRPALKSVRDAVAIWLWGGKKGQRDSDARGVWKYGQAKCDRGVFGVTIDIRGR